MARFSNAARRRMLAAVVAVLGLMQAPGELSAEPLKECGDPNADLKQGTLDTPELNQILAGCGELLNRDSLNPYIYFNIGLAFEAGGERDKAISYYSKAIGIKGDFVRALNYRGNVYNLNGDSVSALADQTRAISADPKDYESWHSRYDANYNLKNYRAAINDITKAIELAPKEDFLLYYNRGETYEKLGDAEAAKADYTKADAILPYTFPPLENAMKRLGQQPTPR